MKIDVTEIKSKISQLVCDVSQLEKISCDDEKAMERLATDVQRASTGLAAISRYLTNTIYFFNRLHNVTASKPKKCAKSPTTL